MENPLLAEYVKLGPIDRLRELAQADKEGRVVVLPCEIGDTVYHITTCEHFPQILDGTMYGPNGEPGTATGRYCPCELSETCPFDVEDFDCEKNKKKLAVFPDTVAGLYIADYKVRINLDYSGTVNVLDFGNTGFLNREDAEVALAEKGGTG